MKIQTTTLVLLLLAAALPADAQVVADSGAFIVRLGEDTIAVERYVRTRATLTAEAALRTPQTRAYTMKLTFRDDGGVSWYEVKNDPVAGVPNSAPAMRSVTTYVGNSANVQAWYAAQPSQPRSMEATREMIPLQLPFYSTYETALIEARNKARAAGTDTVTMTMLSTGGPLSYNVTFGPGDSVKLAHPVAGTIRARMDEKGRLLAFDGTATTFKVVVTRAKWVDIEAHLKRYAELDAAGKAIGPLSPRDSVLGMLGDASEVFVSYGRPSRRGRATFGNIVPWGEVWRTGANESTTIIFADTVEIGGVTIPNGKYSLWTIPDTTQWQLIINKQTGQWGTSYDKSQDLVRIPVETESVPVPLETFTIEFKPEEGEAAIMMMTWDRTRVIVPIRKK